MQDLTYLHSLGYSEKEIADYSERWNERIIEYLAKNSDYVAGNMSYLKEDFEKDLLLKLTVFYPETFALQPELFQKRIQMLKETFPDDWKQLIEQQFWGYDGIAGTNYEPILRVMSSYDDKDVKAAIEQLQNPDKIIFEFMVLLSRDAGIEISVEDIPENALWWLEKSKYEVVRNAKQLIDKGVSAYTIEDIICYNPYLMELSELEVESMLKEAFGEDYINSMEEMDHVSFIDKLLEIG